MHEFKLPSLGADMDDATILEWRVKPGDAVKKGQVVVEVDTSKAAFEVEVDRDGVIDAILVEPGKKIAVGTVLARLRVSGEAPLAQAPAAAPAMAPHPRVSPLAASVAADLGVDLKSISHGSGIDGLIVRADVEAAAKNPAAPPKTHARHEGLRDAIAAAMSRSKREIPHYYLEQTLDLEAALTWLEAQNAKRPMQERILPSALLLKAVTAALDEVPELNGYWRDGRADRAESVHLGVAISLHGGVIAPAIRDADEKSLEQLMAALSDLVERARHGALKPGELTDSTITVTNLGDRGPDLVHGVIYPPQLALVGFGAIAQRPLAVGGQVLARRCVIATLAADHRATDGHRGGLFLRALARLLEHPESL